MAKGKFLFGVIVGVFGAYAAKKVYDNREEVVATIKEKTKEAKEEVTHFVDFASDKINDISEEVTKKANEYAAMAKEQLKEIKETLNEDDEGDLTLEFDEEE